MIICTASDFLIWAPTITLQSAPCFPKYGSQAMGFIIITWNTQWSNGELTCHPTAKANKNDDVLIGMCSKGKWGTSPQTSKSK